MLFATKGLELVDYLESSNHMTTERVFIFWFMVLECFIVFTWIYINIERLIFKVTMNFLHTILKHFEVSTTSEILRFSN